MTTGMRERENIARITMAVRANCATKDIVRKPCISESK